jgi:hypothetical protein
MCKLAVQVIFFCSIIFLYCISVPSPLNLPQKKWGFSFGKDYVSLRRHQLSPSSVTKGMAVAFYSNNGKIKPGVLHKWKLNKANEAKQKGKAKDRSKRRQCAIVFQLFLF